jgi:hypothetical protein
VLFNQMPRLGGAIMSVHEDLTVAHHQQDTNYYCGAACAQMVLDSIGAGLLDQDDLYADNHNHSTIESGWATAPDGLQWTMNARRPAGFMNSFVIYPNINSEDAISRKIVWTIHHYQVAPIALVFGSGHWIVVRGFDASAAPANYGDTSYAIDGFYVNNPWPPVPSFYAPSVPPPPPPPPHSAADGCGTGGNRGVADEHITYHTWQDTYMTGVNWGHWNGQFVAVCDPDPPAERRGILRPAAKRLAGKQLLEPKISMEHALGGLKEHGLFERERWAKALRNSTPGTPSLVHRLDRLDSFYYIVPFATPAKTITAAAIVDARFGDYCQAIAFPEEGLKALITVDKRAVNEMVVGRLIQLEKPLGGLRIRKEGFCLYPTLVWRPCLESLSPYYPFYMYTVGEYRIYVRIDGKVFTTLHTDIHGV